MKGIILLIAGLILAGAGVFAFFLIKVVFEGVVVGSFPYDLCGLQGILQYGVSSLAGGLGAKLAIKYLAENPAASVLVF